MGLIAPAFIYPKVSQTLMIFSRRVPLMFNSLANCVFLINSNGYF
jgi:hypothetical protein